MTTILPGEAGVHFKVWAPKRQQIQVAIEGRFFSLNPETGGYFGGTVKAGRAGSLYKFKLDGDGYLYPDPQSRFQPDGPHGESQVIDPGSFRWTDRDWQGVSPQGQVVYEMHIGTFTREGTWDAAREQLPELSSIGVTVIELMPVAEFPGRWGWGYDGVALFAPTHLYGCPDDAKRFVNAAHELGVGVILDVVYNHFGPDGSYVKAFADEYFTDKYSNDWGEAINFDSVPVREFYLDNAAYWIEEFHFDGLRLDATQDIHDTSEEHILAAITRHVRKVAGSRKVYLIAENEPQQSWIARPVECGGYGIDGLWNDDFHHSAMVALTGRREAYYTDYRGSAQEFISAAKYGYLYQGQRYRWQKKRRGSPAFDLKPWNFVTYLQNHDQIANSGWGARLNTVTDPALYRAMSALLMLGPSTPMLFQGQEFGATTPFFYFCDHHVELGAQVSRGRKKFLAQFRSLAQPEMQQALIDPGGAASFEACKLDAKERRPGSRLYVMYKDLMRLRREDAVFKNPESGRLDGATLSENALVIRYFSQRDVHRLLIVNLGADLHLDPAPEPLLAPPVDSCWSVLWSSEDPKYGGTGTASPDSEDNWRIAGHSALVLAPSSIEEDSE